MSGAARRRARAREQARVLGLDRLGFFVPALMSVGLVFWIASEIAELVRSRAEDTRRRRARVAAEALVDEALDRHPDAVPGLRPRPLYLLLFVALVASAAYVLVGSVFNFAREGYVEGVAWLLALAAATSVVAVGYAVVALVVFVTWPRPPAWARSVLLHSPLGATTSDADAGDRPSWLVTTFLVLAVFLLATLAAFVAWSPGWVDRFNETVGSWLVRHDPLASLDLLDELAGHGGAIAAALVACLLARRCRVVVACYVGSLVAGLVLCAALGPLVAHVGPTDWSSTGRLETFPSSSVMLATLFAGLMPLALAVLFERTWIIRPLQLALGVLVVARASHDVAGGVLPTTALGGLAVGLVMVLASQRLVDRGRSHASCDGCPWSVAPYHGPVLGAVPIPSSAQQALRLAARLTAAVAAVGLTWLTLTVDVPEEAAGYGFGPSVQVAVGIGLAAIMAFGALLSWRWEAAGAVLVALAAAGAGIFASVEYGPWRALVATAVLMIPAVLLWLSWQHTRRPAQILVVAVLTAALIGTTWASADVVHDRLYGPTHPDSTAALLPIDRVQWVWSGGLSATGITVTARLADDDAGAAQLLVEPADGGAPVLTDPVRADPYRLVRFTVDDLAPERAYGYRVVVDGHADETRGRGRFRTPAIGPYSFRVAAASCSRSGSNAAVYDAIRREDPLLYLQTGDLSYDNPDSTSPSTVVDLYTRALTTAAQSALAREVPMAYVWDDHDYGPNDADASYPGRAASREAYRRAVPHYPVPDGDAPIYQSFTIGRVGFVITDARSEHTSETMLGETQLAWLLDELRRSSQTHALVVWISTVPWIEQAEPGNDGWAGQAAERTRIADVIAGAGIRNLLMISGDAHMVAIDDGTNSDYSTSRTDGFPVLAAAALDRPGNVKGGPYSEGTFPGAGQYGLLDIFDDGGDVLRVRAAGRTWQGTTLVEREFAFPVPATAMPANPRP